MLQGPSMVAIQDSAAAGCSQNKTNTLCLLGSSDEHTGCGGYRPAVKVATCNNCPPPPQRKQITCAFLPVLQAAQQEVGVLFGIVAHLLQLKPAAVSGQGQ